MPQPATCTYCDRPAVISTTRRAGRPRVSAYADPRSKNGRDESHVEVVRYCGVVHRP